MPADQYDSLLKGQLQRLAKKRELDAEGTVAILRERLRAWDRRQEGEPVEEEEETEVEEETEDDGEEEEEEDEEEGEEEEEDAPAPMALAMPGEELKDGHFRYTVTAGNDLFFGDPLWHAANEDMALLEAGRAGYRYLRSMGDMEYIIEGNRVHYQFPVERL